MTVNELIKTLELVDDKNKDVFVYGVDAEEIFNIDSVDLTISDRVDLNIYKYSEYRE